MTYGWGYPRMMEAYTRWVAPQLAKPRRERIPGPKGYERPGRFPGVDPDLQAYIRVIGEDRYMGDLGVAVFHVFAEGADPKFYEWELEEWERVFRQSLRDDPFRPREEDELGVAPSALIRLSEAAALAGMQTQALYRRMARGRIEGVKLYGRWFLKWGDFEAITSGPMPPPRPVPVKLSDASPRLVN